MAHHRTSRCSLLLAAILIATAAPHTASAQIGLGLSPMRLEFGVSPGAAHSGSLTLSNESGAPIRVRAELLDFYIDDQETPQFAPSYPSERESSCRSWLTVNPMEAEVAHSHSSQVRYSLRVPPDAPPASFHCAIGFTTLPTLGETSGLGLRTAVRMVAAIYAQVGKPSIEGEVSAMSLESTAKAGAEGPQWQAVVTIRNAGVTHFRPSGDLALLDESGAVLETIPFPPLPVLPKREQRFRFRLKSSLHQQAYTLRTRVDLGGNEIQETTMRVVPPAAK
ncbi:MAG: hypothetical protein JSU00_08020 [Acidobacteria bacterium]|nr:hypothetical protein [Acidobacteriota bacterium]